MSISNGPEIGLSQKQKEIFENFPERVSGWKNFLLGLGFAVESMGDYEPPEGVEDSDDNLIVTRGNGINCRITGSEAKDKNLIMIGSCFISMQQFLANKPWPDLFINEPGWLEVRLLPKQQAEIILWSGEGERPLFDKSKYFNPESSGPVIDGDYIGSQNEAAGLLIEITKEIAENLELSQAPQLTKEVA